MRKNRRLKRIWYIINSRFWNNICWLTCIVHQMLVFFEPVNSQSQHIAYNSYLLLTIIELTIISILTTDTILNIYFKYRASRQTTIKKILIKAIFLILIAVDCIYAAVSYPKTTIRFARTLRALYFISYSKYMRRNISGIINSLQDLLILFLLYFIVILIYAFVGTNLIGDLSQDVPIDYLANDFSEFFNLSFILYILSTLDYYPDMYSHILPTLVASKYYLFYFIPFLLLFIFLFTPIPQALIYENFRLHRIHILKSDKEKQKQALQMCFYCLDIDNTEEIAFQVVFDFFKRIYSRRNQDEDIKELLSLMDLNDSKTFSLDEFYIVFLLINRFNRFSLNRINAPAFWEGIRGYLNEKLKLKQFVEGVEMGVFMFVLTLINCTLIFIAFFIQDSEVILYFELIDKIFFGFYVLEILLKVLAHGVYDFYDDDWNKFDFFIVFFQFVFDFILMKTLNDNLGSSLKANRAIRLAKLQKIQKVFRLFRAFRSVKVASIILDGLAIFEEVKKLLLKILKCLPLVLKFTTLIWVLFYIYSVIAVEVLYTDQYTPNIYSRVLCDADFIQNREDDSLIYWGGCEYSDFQTIDRAMLMFLQVFLNSWADILNDFSHRQNNYWSVAIFLGTFVFFSLFLMALINGLVWEIFNDRNQFLKLSYLVSQEEQQLIKILEQHGKKTNVDNGNEDYEIIKTDVLPSIKQITISEQKMVKSNPFFRYQKQPKTLKEIRVSFNEIKFGKIEKSLNYFRDMNKKLSYSKILKNFSFLLKQNLSMDDMLITLKGIESQLESSLQLIFYFEEQANDFYKLSKDGKLEQTIRKKWPQAKSLYAEDNIFEEKQNYFILVYFECRETKRFKRIYQMSFCENSRQMNFLQDFWKLLIGNEKLILSKFDPIIQNE